MIGKNDCITAHTIPFSEKSGLIKVKRDDYKSNN